MASLQAHKHGWKASHLAENNYSCSSIADGVPRKEQEDKKEKEEETGKEEEEEGNEEEYAKSLEYYSTWRSRLSCFVYVALAGGIVISAMCFNLL